MVFGIQSRKDSYGPALSQWIQRSVRVLTFAIYKMSGVMSKT